MRHSTLMTALGVLIGFSSYCVTGSAEEYHSGPISVHSDGRGQLSSAVYTMVEPTAGVIKVNYIAPAAHCSSLKMHFLVDGVERAVSGPVDPGHETGEVDLGPVPPGVHAIGFQAEGILGGCDVGYVTAWEGSATVWTSDNPAAPIDTMTASCGGGLMPQGWRVRVFSDGTVYDMRYTLREETIQRTLHVPVERVQALFSRAQVAGLMTLTLKDFAEMCCELTLTAGGISHDLGMYAPTDGPATVREIFSEIQAMAVVKAIIN
jgi:hypothetical protein